MGLIPIQKYYICESISLCVFMWLFEVYSSEWIHVTFHFHMLVKGVFTQMRFHMLVKGVSTQMHSRECIDWIRMRASEPSATECCLLACSEFLWFMLRKLAYVVLPFFCCLHLLSAFFFNLQMLHDTRILCVWGGVATTSRLLKITGLFCKRAL